jgi:hypothetical protein
MAKLLNLDKFINENRSFKIADMEFFVPGLISVETVLKISKLGQEVTECPEKTSDVLDAVWKILEPVNYGKTRDDFASRISSPMLKELLPFIFNDQGGEDVETGMVDLSKNVSGGGMTPNAK